MEYVVTQRYRRRCLSGDVNVPYGTPCVELGGIITVQDTGAALCLTTSQDAYDFFARNDDGKGLERGELIRRIKKLLQVPPGDPPQRSALDAHKRRWAKLWGESSLSRFRRAKEHPDYWVWGHDFYNAEINDLTRIYNIVKGA